MPHPGGIQRLYRPRADLSALAHRKWMPSVNVTGDLTACATHWLQFAETDVTLSAFHVWHSERPAGAETWLQPLLHRGTTFTEQLLSSAASLSLSYYAPPATEEEVRKEVASPWGLRWKAEFSSPLSPLPIIWCPNGARPPVFCRMSWNDKRNDNSAWYCP